MKELSALQNKHLNLPTMDDSIDEEHAIEIQTQEITQVREIGKKKIELSNLYSIFNCIITLLCLYNGFNNWRSKSFAEKSVIKRK